jgi:hypothetical protein
MESAAAPALYVVDTSVWIDLVPFRPAVFVTLWARIEVLATDGRLVVPEEVDRELNPSPDQPAIWVHDRPHIHRSTTGLWDRAREVADRYPALVNLAKPRGSADPFVVALAIDERERSESGLWPRDAVVVTNETSHLPSRVALPDACAGYGIRSVDMYGWFAAEGWSF